MICFYNLDIYLDYFRFIYVSCVMMCYVLSAASGHAHVKPFDFGVQAFASNLSLVKPVRQ